MSYSFYVHDVPESASLQNLLSTLPYDDVAAIPETTSGWPEVAYIHREGTTVRAIETECQGGVLQVRIFSASAPEDYELALNIAIAAARQFGGKIESEEGVSGSHEEIAARYDSHWCQDHAATTFDMLMKMSSEDAAELQLNGVTSKITIGPRMNSILSSVNGAAANHYYSCLRELNYENDEYFRASVIVIAKGEQNKKVARISTLTRSVPTMLMSTTPILAIGPGMDGPDDSSYHVRTSDFISKFGDSLRWISEDTFITDGIDGPAWEEVQHWATNNRLDDLFADESLLSEDKDSKTEPAEATLDHEATLALALPMIFGLVAGADGQIDKKELNSFAKSIVTTAEKQKESISKYLLLGASHVAQCLEELHSSGPAKSIQVLSLTREAAYTVLGNEDGQEYLNILYNTGENIAKASGGIFGIGSKIGKEEAVVLSHLRQLLLEEH